MAGLCINKGKFVLGEPAEQLLFVCYKGVVCGDIKFLCDTVKVEYSFLFEVRVWEADVVVFFVECGYVRSKVNHL